MNCGFSSARETRRVCWCSPVWKSRALKAAAAGFLSALRLDIGNHQHPRGAFKGTCSTGVPMVKPIRKVWCLETLDLLNSGFCGETIPSAQSHARINGLFLRLLRCDFHHLKRSSVRFEKWHGQNSCGLWSYVVMIREPLSKNPRRVHGHLFLPAQGNSFFFFFAWRGCTANNMFL